MAMIPWDELPEPAYARLVSMLLQRMMPDAEVMDGRGGDGGRDVQLRRAGTLTVYELKHFTGRVSARSPKRREQVEHSLARAAKLNPTEWHLVVPIDHNSSELEWFDALRARYPFIRAWRGLTWLNTQFSAHPDLVRGALNTVNDELLAAIREHRAERDMLTGGLPDLAARLDVLQARADEISPHYRVEVSLTGRERSVSVFPKHDRALELAPINVTGHFAFPDDEPGQHAHQQFLDAFGFGDDLDLDGTYARLLTISGPAELCIDETLQLDRFQLEQQLTPITPPLRATLAALDANRRTLVEVGLVFTERRFGHMGVVLKTTDAAGLLVVHARIDMMRGTSSLSLSLRCPERVLPSALIPALQLLSCCAPPNLMRLAFHIDDAPSFTEAAVGAAYADDDLLELFDLIERLAAIQGFTRSFFELPGRFTATDVQLIHRASRLIAGEHVVLACGRTTITFTPTGADVPFDLGPDGEFRLALAYEHTPINISGHELDLGPSVLYVSHGKLLNHREVTAARGPGQPMALDIDLSLGEDFKQVLGRLDKVVL